MADEFRSLACVGYPKYEISESGIVISLQGKYGIKRRVLKQRVDKQGYLLVHLSEGGKNSWKSVHRLVASAFIPNPNNLPQVNHKDENKQNNHVSNLEWCTAAYNSNYGTRNEKVIQSLIGRECKEETRRKIAMTRMGDNNPMKREGVRSKNSEAHKGKISPKRGCHLSEETKQKIRDTKKRKRQEAFGERGCKALQSIVDDVNAALMEDRVRPLHERAAEYIDMKGGGR